MKTTVPLMSQMGKGMEKVPYINERTRILKDYGLEKEGPCELEAMRLLAKWRVTMPVDRGGVGFKIGAPEGFKVISMGGFMEQNLKLLKAANAEVEASKVILQDLVNEAKATNDFLQQILLSVVKELRDKRMTVVTEIRHMLAELKDIRKFFLEDAHENEVKRLEGFVGLCKEMRELKKDGTLDAVADVVIKLAMRGDKDER